MSAPETLKIGAIAYKSRSHAARVMLEGRAAGRNHMSKADIAKKVGMTPQTVHAVQRLAGIEIDFRGEQKILTAQKKEKADAVKAKEKAKRDAERVKNADKKAKEKAKADAVKAKEKAKRDAVKAKAKQAKADAKAKKADEKAKKTVDEKSAPKSEETAPVVKKEIESAS